MLCFHAARGGAGCSVVAVTTALLARRSTPTVLVDLAGDVPDLFGIAPDGPSLRDWLTAPAPHPGSLSRLTRTVGPGLRVLSVGRARRRERFDPERVRLLARALAELADRSIVDVGVPDVGTAPLVAAADRALLVTRACYLSVTTAATGPTPDGVVVVRELGRSYRARDIEDAIGAPVVAQVDWDPLVARAVDAGTLVARTPRLLGRLEALL